MKACAASLVVALLLLAAVTRADDGPARPEPPAIGPLLAASLWTFAQLIPSPLLITGSGGLQGGVRWQLTPLLYSFGVVENPFRSFVVAPVARHTGAVELFVSPEWACCAPRARSSWLARAGARVYWPVVLRGEALAASVGGSYSLAGHGHGAAIELGVYTLSSILGWTLTYSPTLLGREFSFALTLHYY